MKKSKRLLYPCLFASILSVALGNCNTTHKSIPPYNSRILIGASNGSMWVSDDGLHFTETIPPWSWHGGKNNPIRSYGNIYDLSYQNDILTASADLNHVFVSFDRGRTWNVNKAFLSGSYPFPNNGALGDRLEDYILNRTPSPVVGTPTNNKGSDQAPITPGREIDNNPGAVLDFRGIAGDGQSGYMMVASRSHIYTNTSGNPLSRWNNFDCRTITPFTEFFKWFDKGRLRETKNIEKIIPNGRCNMFLTGIKYGGGSFILLGGAQQDAIQSVSLYTSDYGNTWKIPNIPLDKNGYKILDLKFINNRWVALISVDVFPYPEERNGISRTYNILMQSSTPDPGSSWSVIEGTENIDIDRADQIDISPDERALLAGLYGISYSFSSGFRNFTNIDVRAAGSSGTGNPFKVYYAPKKDIWYVLTAQGWLYYTRDLRTFKQIRLGLHSLNTILEF